MKCSASCWRDKEVSLLFFHSSYWVVLSKRKGRRSWCSVLLACLRASVTAHLPADETTADIRLEGGPRGRWSPFTLHPVCMCVSHLHRSPTGLSGFPGRWTRRRFDVSSGKRWKSGVMSPRSPSQRSAVGGPTSASTSQGGRTETWKKKRKHL